MDKPGIFSFAEFLAALALMVLAWTIADFRYRFRIRIAPIPLRGITFFVVGGVGTLTLATDLWIAEQWPVPRGNLISTAVWQAVLGGCFFVTFLMWAWFAFIKPPRFGPANAERFGYAVYFAVLKGDPSELAVVADEFTSSAANVVHYAAPKHRNSETRIRRVDAYAQDLLLLISDPRFCRAVIAKSPGTALAVFREMETQSKYDVPVGTFGQNLISEAMTNRDSFLFHETEGYRTGLMGYLKPLSQTIFGNYRIVESAGTLLDPWHDSKWDAAQWAAFSRIALLALKGYISHGQGQHSSVLYRAFGYIENSPHDLYKLNGLEGSSWEDDARQRLAVAVDFLKEAVAELDQAPRQYAPKRVRDRHSSRRTIHDRIADAIFEIIVKASSVKSPRTLAWMVQHNDVWGEFFNFSSLSGPAGKIIKFKVRRRIYDAILELEKFGNYQSAYLLGLCLNVMGLSLREHGHDLDTRALHRVVLKWTQEHFLELHARDPWVAEACLLDGLTLDETNRRLARESGLGRRPSPSIAFLDLIPPQTLE